MEGEKVIFVAAPVIAYRAWVIYGDNLTSINKWGYETETKWVVKRPGAFVNPDPVAGDDPGTGFYGWAHSDNKAICVQRATVHPAPQLGCQCGFWSLFEEQAAQNMASQRQPRAGYAWGQVECWGTIVEGTKGYRSEYARPVEINVVHRSRELAERIGARYNCTVNHFLPDEISTSAPSSASATPTNCRIVYGKGTVVYQRRPSSHPNRWTGSTRATTRG